ncbi:hypothetical protein JZ751_022312, partial [Albula glossodonta]
MPICSLCPALTHRGHDVVCSEPGTQNDSYTKRVDEWIVQHHPTQDSAGVIPAPVGLTIDSVTTTSFSVRWSKPDELDQTPSFLVSNCSPGTDPQFISTELHSTVLSNLQPGRQYTVSVCTVLENGEQSETVSRTLYTEPSSPESLRVEEVKSRSVRLCWDKPTDMEGVSYTFSIIYTCDGEKPRELTTESNSSTADLCDLKPGMEYSFSICTVLHNGTRSRVCLIQAHTQPSAPGKLNISSVCETSLCLSWDRPTDMERVPHTFRVTWGESTGQTESITADESHKVLSYLRPGTEYSISVCTVLQSTGLESESVHTIICTKPSPPESFNICHVSETSVCLSWDRPPYMEGVPYTFRVTWGEFREQSESITTDENFTVLSHLRPVTEYSISVCAVLQNTGLESEPEVSYTFSIIYTCDGEEPRELTAGSNINTADLCDLKPGMEYSFSICTVLHNGTRSRVCSTHAYTSNSPKKVVKLFVSTTSTCLSWDRPTDMEDLPHTFRVTWEDSRWKRQSITADNLTVLSHLRPGTEYRISVCTVLQSTGLESEPVHTTVCTKPYPPGRLRVDEVRNRSVRLCWDTPTNMEGVSYTFSITYTCYGGETRELSTESNSSTADLCDLKPGMEYSFSICTVLHNGTRSRVCSARAHT